MIIRQLRQTDHDKWRVLWASYLEFYQVELDDDVYDTLWQRLHLADHYEPHGLVADNGDQLVGLTHFVVQRHVWRKECVTYISDLFVEQSMRGERLGERLIEAVYERADALDAPYVYWATDHDNAPARKLYERTGFLTKSILYRRFEGRM